MWKKNKATYAAVACNKPVVISAQYNIINQTVFLSFFFSYSTVYNDQTVAQDAI